MSVESMFLSKDGKSTIKRILTFMRSLVIKVNVEANEYETIETYENWLKYKLAYERIDKIEDYSGEYGRDELIKAGFSSGFIDQHKLDRYRSYEFFVNNSINKEYYKTQHNKLMNILREKRKRDFNELNPYYKRFLGVPETDDQIIYITNRDSSTPPVIPLHKVNAIDHPNTYNWLYLEDGIKTIRNDHPDYSYLNYVNKPINLYKLRTASNFEILRCEEQLLNKQELINFYKCYERTKRYIDRVDYIPGFEERYEQYSYLMEMMLLYSTFTSFSNSYLDKYILCDYSDQEIFDILDSNNLSELKSVDIKLLRKIIPHLPDLLEYRGSSEIIDKILDIINDNMLTIKRYEIIKKLPIKNNKIEFDTNIGELAKLDSLKGVHPTYVDGVDIVFKEKVVRKGDKYIESVFNKEYKYHEFVQNDDTWAGCTNVDDSETKRRLRENLRKEILTMDFSSILTKYVNISSILDTHAKQIKIHNLMGILWQYNAFEGNNFLATDEVTYEDISVTPLVLFAAICYINNIINGVVDFDTIRQNPMTISSVIAMRDISGLIKKSDGNNKIITAGGTIANNFKDGLKDKIINPIKMLLGIDDPFTHTAQVDSFTIDLDLYNIRIKDILDETFDKYLGSELALKQLDHNIYGDEYIGPNRTKVLADLDLRDKAFTEYLEKNFLVKFDISKWTLRELLESYESQDFKPGEFNNKDILKNIEDQIIKSNNIKDYMTWKYILEQNRITDTFVNMFEGYGRFTDYIKSKNEEFYNHLKDILNKAFFMNDRGAVTTLCTNISNTFFNYISKKTDGVLNFKLEDDVNSGENKYLDDLKLIFNNFLSIYSQIYQIEYNEVIEDSNNSRISLFYLNLMDSIIEDNGGGNDPNPPGPNPPPGPGPNPDPPGPGPNPPDPEEPQVSSGAYRLYLWLRYYMSENMLYTQLPDEYIGLKYFGSYIERDEQDLDIRQEDSLDILKYEQIVEKFSSLENLFLILSPRLIKELTVNDYNDTIKLLYFLSSKSIYKEFIDLYDSFVLKYSTDNSEYRDSFNESLLLHYRCVKDDIIDEEISENISSLTYTSIKDKVFDE